MKLTYQNNILYIDLEGNVNVEEVSSKINSLNNTYNFNKLELNTEDAFLSDYKRMKLKKNLLTITIKK